MGVHEERIEPWDMIESLLQTPVIRAVYWDAAGFSVDLIDEGGDQNEVLVFDDFFSYKVTHESYLLKIWGTLDESMSGRIFYQVRESAYIKQFNELSLGIYNDLDVTHFAVYTDDICVDVGCSVYSPYAVLDSSSRSMRRIRP